MGTEIITTTNNTNLTENLEVELENARATLRGVEDDIKKVFGKDPSELNFQRGRRNVPPLGNERRSFHEEHTHTGSGAGGDRDDGQRRRLSTTGGRGILDSNRLGRKIGEDEPMEKRWKYQDKDNHNYNSNHHGHGHPQRTTPLVIASRIKPRYESDEDQAPSINNNLRHAGAGGPPGFGFGTREREREREPRRLQSRIVSSIKEKSRDEVLAAQRQDRNGRDRNRRMFGALLGTLHQFKQDETKLKDKEEKRAQIEAKLDEADKQEREAVKKQKQQLIRDRKLKLTEIKRLEIKKRRLEELEAWESTTKNLKNFIHTETKPHIFYIPKVLNPITECKLEESKMLVEEMIANRRQEVITDLENFEQRSKRYWDSRINFDGVEAESRKRKLSTGGGIEADPFGLDENMEDELKELMKGEDYEHDGEGDHDDSFISAHENSITKDEPEHEEHEKLDNSEHLEMEQDINADNKKDNEPEVENENHQHSSPSSQTKLEEYDSDE